MTRKVLLLAALSAIQLTPQAAKKAAPAPVSDAVNAGLPKWLRFSGEERVRGEGPMGIGFKRADDGYLLNRLRLNMDVKPAGWLKFSFQAQDSRVFGQNTRPAPASQKDALDLWLGFVDLGNAEEGRAAVRFGRQSLVFGEGRLLGDPNWSNVGRVFDAARMTVRAAGLRADVFTGLLVKTAQSDFNRNAPGEHLHGVYASADKIVPGAVVEPYALWRLAHGFRSERSAPGKLDVKTVGARWVGKLPLGLDYGVEMAGQYGRYAGDGISAWAGHWVLGHTLADSRRRPRLFTEFNRASGDENPRDGRRGTFDPLFPSAHDKYGLADLFGWTNLNHWKNGLELTVRLGLTAAASYSSFWLASATDALYSGGKAVARSLDGSAGTHIGQEADIQATWNASRTTQINAGYGRLFPGGFLKRTTAGKPYNLVFLNIVQKF